MKKRLSSLLVAIVIAVTMIIGAPLAAYAGSNNSCGCNKSWGKHRVVKHNKRCYKHKKKCKKKHHKYYKKYKFKKHHKKHRYGRR
ncbi:MAG: hypothetical protein HY779_05465 [Rubrobacteridae bacterium]|nr:hypothetical protein [Rubrobacteridae bacterium]